MEVTLRWLAGQKETPSFSNRWNDNVSSILDAPLPKSLQTYDDFAEESHAERSFTQNRSRTPTASYGHSRGTAIHDSLLERGKLMAMRREALQEKALEDEEKASRPKPKPKPLDTGKDPIRKEPIQDRLMRKGKEKAIKETYEEEIRAQQLSKTLQASAPFRPNISGRGKRAESKVMTADYHKNWHRRREQRLEARRTENLLKEIGDVRDGPDINLRSQKLAAAKREKEGLAGMSHVEAMLERDRLTKLAAWERSQKEMEAMSNPQITVFAATLQRDRPVSERLYGESFDAEERRMLRLKSALSAQEGSRAFSPRISRLAASVPRMMPVEDEIMQRHLEAQAVLEQKRRMEEEREDDCHQPAINPVSDAIACRMATSAKERLYATTVPRHTDPGRLASPSASRGMSTTRSASVLTTVSTGMSERLEAMAQYEEKKESNLQRLKREKEEREFEACTFAPTTNRNIRAAGSVLERNEQWQVRRDMKLEEQRRTQADSELKDCTFAPSLAEAETDHSVARRHSNEATIYGGDRKPWGSAEFIQRMEEARKMRDEKLQRQVPATDKWVPTITQPVEFHLGRSKTPVKSLQRPSGERVISIESPLRQGVEGRNERSASSVDSSGYLYTGGGGSIVPPSLWRAGA